MKKLFLLLLTIALALSFLIACNENIAEYKVTFEINGQTEKVLTVKDGDTIDPSEIPTIPEKTGYEGKWNITLFNNLKSDITAVVIYTPIEYSITYHMNGGEVTDSSLIRNYSIESDDIKLPQLQKAEYVFVGWYDNSEFNGEQLSNIPKGSTGNIQLYAFFEIQQKYRVTLNYESAESVTLNGDGLYAPNSLVEIDAQLSEEGYEFDGWYNGDIRVSPDQQYSFHMPENNVTYTAKYKKTTFALTILNNDPKAGLTSGNGEYEWGAEVSVIATPNEGFVFIGWLDESGEIVSEVAEYSFTMPKNSVKFTACWGSANFSLNLINTNPLAGTVLGSGEYIEGDQVTIAAQPNDGYDFIGWYNGLELFNENATHTFYMLNNALELSAKWKKTEYNLILKGADIEGILSGGGLFEWGKNVTITAIANPGYRFAGWQFKGQIVSTDASYAFDMPKENCDYTALWEIIEYNLTIINGDTDAGNVDGSGKYREGDDVILTATANTGYLFIGWFYNDELIDSSESFGFKMPGYTLEYTTVWRKIEYTLNIGSDDAQAGNVSGGGKYEWGNSVTVTATAYEGYCFAGWFDGENAVSYDEIYTFEMPQYALIYTAMWQAGTNGLTYTKLVDGTYAVTGGDASGSLVIPATYRGEDVTEISSSAFFGNQNITALEFAPGSNVKIIESYAFYNSGLIQIILPESLQAIKTQAFSFNAKVAKLVLPEKTVQIENNAFGLNGLREIHNLRFAYGITLFKNVLEAVGIIDTQVPQGAFSGYTMLKNVEFVGVITSIADNAFEKCISLRTIELPAGLKTIGVSAFRGGGLLQVTVPDSVTSLGEGAFAECKSLQSANINAPLSRIPDSLFSGASELYSFSISANITEIGNYAFNGCINITAFGFTEGLQTIGEYAFYNTGFTSIILPEGLLNLGQAAFGGNANLIKAVIPSSVQNAAGVFYGSYNLEDLTAPIAEGINTIKNYFIDIDTINVNRFAVNGGSTISDNFFSSAAKLQTIFISSTITQISGSAFDFYNGSVLERIDVSAYNPVYSSQNGVLYNKTSTVLIKYPSNIEGSFTVPQGVNKIEQYAFSQSLISGIILPDSLITIGDSAFSLCANLKTIDIPYTIEAIGSSALNAWFEEINIPQNSRLNTVGDYAFGGSFTQIHFPATLDSIGQAVLFSARNLQEITIPFVGQHGNGEGDVTFNYLFKDSFSTGYWGGIKKVTILGGSVIGDRAFENMSHIEQIILPKGGLKIIGERAFYGLFRLSNIEIFYGVQSIGKNAFDGMSAVKQLFVPDTLNYIGSGAFNNMSALEYVRLPFLGSQYSSTEYGAHLSYAFNALGENCKILLAGGDRLSAGAFLGFNTINEIQLPNTLIRIDTIAFKGLNRIKQLFIPESVTYMGLSCLEGMSSLEELTLPFVGQSLNNSNKRESGLSYVFGGNIEYSNSHTFVPQTLKKVNILGGTKIAQRAFWNLTQIEQLYLSDNITNIELAAFEGMYGIQNLSIPFIGVDISTPTRLLNFFTTQPEYASLPHSLVYVKILRGEIIENALDSYIASVEFGAGVRHISSRAFGGSLNNIAVSQDNQHYTSIDGVLFDKSVSTVVVFPRLKQVQYYNLPSTVKTIGEYAFYQAGWLGGFDEVMLPTSVETISKFAFSRAFINSLIFEQGSKLKIIEESAFYGLRMNSDLVIPSSINTIGNKAFSSLVADRLDITGGENLQSIGDNAFSWIITSSVSLSFLPNAFIGEYIFSESTRLEDLTLSHMPIRLRSFFGKTDNDISPVLSKVTILGGENIPISAFENIQSIREVILPSTLKNIGDYAFRSSWAEGIVIPEGVEYIGVYAFASNHNSTIVIPQSIVSIGTGAFSNNGLLTDLYIPLNSNWRLNDYFSNSYMENIYLTSDYNTVNPNAFDDVRGLRNIYVSENNDFYTSVDGVLYSKNLSVIVRYPIGKSGSEYSLGSSVTAINTNAFYQNLHLKKVTAYGSLRQIGANAFAESVLEEFHFNGSMVNGEIGSSAFYNSKLKAINIPNGTKNILSGAFGNTYLTAVNLPNEITVGQNAFSNITTLKDLFMGEGIMLNTRAVSGCGALRLVQIPASTVIESNAFYNCSRAFFATELGADSVNWAEGWNNDRTVYYNAQVLIDDNFEYILVNESYVVVSRYIGIEADIVIPSKLSDVDVRIIESYAFSIEYNSSLADVQSIRIPETVEIIKKDGIKLDTTIYCAAIVKPDGWEQNWAGYNAIITWGEY